MNGTPATSESLSEQIDLSPAVEVSDAEYWRLLGYPAGEEPTERARELAGAARRWFAAHGRPWIYLREVALQSDAEVLWLDGVAFPSGELRRHLSQSGAGRAVVVAVSAGAACEARARALWDEGKPDEYFFMEVLGSAVVEQLIAQASGRICDQAEREGWRAVRHYSPGYTGWDIAEQPALFNLIADGRHPAWPGQIEVLTSGMLRPKKSLLAVVGLTSRPSAEPGLSPGSPCENCALTPCRYRRAAYRHAATVVVEGLRPDGRPAASPKAGYSVNPRALAKWATERVGLVENPDGSVDATFRFDGTTCSNQGRSLAFDYRVRIAPPEAGRTILEADCRPAADDEGHRFMCAYLQDAAALMRAVEAERPLLGRPLDAVLTWKRASTSSGCFCDEAARAHKWGLALEAIHFALARQPGQKAGTAAGQFS